MIMGDQQQSPTLDVRTLRLHGLGVLIGAPITLALVIALWLFLGAQLLKEPSSPVIGIARFILAPFAFLALIGAPICFIAAVVQLISGKRIGMVEHFFQKEAPENESATSQQRGTNGDKR